MTLAPRSLRARLALASLAFATVAVGAFAVGLAVVVEHAVWGPLDAGLLEEATTLAVLADLPASQLHETVREIGLEEDLGPGKFVRVAGGDRRTLARFRRVPRPVSLRRPARLDGPMMATVGSGAQTYRAAWAPIAGGGHVVMGVRAGGQMTLVRNARLAIVGTASALVVLLAALAWWVTGRATADLGRLTCELETIEAGSLDRRLAARRTSEVDRLVAVLNRMLVRLDASVGHLRRFTADAAHELRTPIAALRTHLDVTLARGHSVDDYRAGLLDALEQAERLGRLSEDLLTLSAVESGAATLAADAPPIRLDVLVREVAEFLAPVAEEQQRPFTCDVDGPVSVRGGESLLKRVVLNLVDNAFRHTPPGTAVRLAVRREGTSVAIEVADEGPGIPAAVLPRVFERFQRGYDGSSGSGLGLALAREIVARHGGRVELSSTPRGTAARVVLPGA